MNPAALRRDAPVAPFQGWYVRVGGCGRWGCGATGAAAAPAGPTSTDGAAADERVVLAAAHLDHDPGNNRLRNLRGLCQRCHLIHDRPHHLAQRRITYLLRRASGDLFLGPYGVPLIPCRIS